MDKTILNKQLFDAFNKDDINACQRVLAAGADVCAADSNGWTPLHHAADKGWLDICKILLSKGANVDAKDNSNGWTPLHRTVDKGLIDICKILLGKGASVDAKDNSGLTPLYYVVASDFWGLGDRFSISDHLGVGRLLVDKGANVNAKDKEGNTLLHYTAKDGRLYACKFLLENRADVNAKNIYGKKPHDVAKTEEIRQLLIAAAGTE